jgi:hypothetical protein
MHQDTQIQYYGYMNIRGVIKKYGEWTCQKKSTYYINFKEQLVAFKVVPCVIYTFVPTVLSTFLVPQHL